MYICRKGEREGYLERERAMSVHMLDRGDGRYILIYRDIARIVHMLDGGRGER